MGVVDGLRPSDLVAQPRPLFFEEGGDPVAWACGKCGRVHEHETNARQCYGCAPRACEDCGEMQEPCHSGYTVCKPCGWARAEKREREAFAKAEKISAAEYDGPVVHEDRFYHELGELLDDVPEGEEPEYVWACRKITPQLDAESILESAVETLEPPEELWDDWLWTNRKAFETFVADWNAKQTSHWYEEDRSRAVVLAGHGGSAPLEPPALEGGARGGAAP